MLPRTSLKRKRPFDSFLPIINKHIWWATWYLYDAYIWGVSESYFGCTNMLKMESILKIATYSLHFCFLLFKLHLFYQEKSIHLMNKKATTRWHTIGFIHGLLFGITPLAPIIRSESAGLCTYNGIESLCETNNL